MAYPQRQNEFNDGTVPNEAKFEGEFDYIYNSLNGTTATDIAVNGNQLAKNFQISTSGGSLLDANGNEIIKTGATVASAVNEITITNAASGNKPLITQTGSGDVGIDIESVTLKNGEVNASSFTSSSTTSGTNGGIFYTANLYKDSTLVDTGTWDISSVVPAAAKAVLIGFTPSAASDNGRAFTFRDSDGSGTQLYQFSPTGGVYTQFMGKPIIASIKAPASGTIYQKAESNGGITCSTVHILGYFI